MEEYDSSYYQKINAEEGPQANRLADVLVWKYNPGAVIDVGCATGLYLRPFLEHGVKVVGVDYADAVIQDEVLQIPRKFIHISDITKKPVGRIADLTICLEVLEHIPASGAQAAIRNICKTSGTIIFSAAQPGQGGVGHINCQPKEYWEKLFQRNGYGRDPMDEEYIKIIMAAGYHMGWLINNLMVFKKQSAS